MKYVLIDICYHLHHLKEFYYKPYWNDRDEIFINSHVSTDMTLKHLHPSILFLECLVHIFTIQGIPGGRRNKTQGNKISLCKLRLLK